jgi:Na+/proline symporter
MTYEDPRFVTADFAIFVITVAISVGIGLYYALSGGKQKTTAEYLVGNRQMSVFP